MIVPCALAVWSFDRSLFTCMQAERSCVQCGLGRVYFRSKVLLSFCAPFFGQRGHEDPTYKSLRLTATVCRVYFP